MKNKSLNLTLLFSLLSYFSYSQIQVDNTVDAENAVNNILLGAGVEAFNITFSGDDDQIGSFNSNGSSVPINAGIILGTGNVNLASGSFDDTAGPGGNTGGGSTSGGANSGATDIDLEQISGQNLNDAAILEFDFTATGDSISFNFMFGSEEYLEWVNSGFNDSFGFFLSGPGIDGGGVFGNNAINLAVVPGTDIPITINSINDVDNSEFYINNPQTTDPNVIEYDGYTTVLVATTQTPLVCDSTYHIKMVIADGSDTGLDSAVFLEAGSFSTNAVQIVGSGSFFGNPVFAGDSIFVEGPDCNSSGVNFILPFEADQDTTIYFDISGTAVNGVDYDLIPDSVIILEGETTNFITFGAIEDGTDEGFESVIFTYEFVTECGDTLNSETTMYIADYVMPTVEIEDQEAICPNTETAFEAVTSGFGGFLYEWNQPNNGTNILNFTPLGSDTIIVTATDVCGTMVTDTAVITIPDYPEIIINFTPDPIPEVTCPGDLVTITAEATGGAGDFTYFWPTEFEFTDVLNVNPQSTQTFSVNATDACQQIASAEIEVIVNPWPGLDITEIPAALSICEGAPVLIGVDVTGGINDDYTYSWTPDGGNTAVTTVFPISDTNYTVTVSDGCGTDELTVSTEVDWPGLDITELPSTPSTCPGDEVLVGVEVSGGVNPNGGTPEYEYDWVNNDTNSTTTVNPSTSTDYSVDVTDGCGTESFTVTATVNLPVQDITTLFDDSLCVGSTENFIDLAGGNGNYIYNVFEFPTDSLVPGAISVIENENSVSYTGNDIGFYTVLISEECAWVNPFEAFIEIVNCDTAIPNVFTPDGDVGGNNETFQIFGLEGFPNSSIIIYSRWGTVVYEDSNYNNNQGWNGKTLSGNDLEEGVYFYLFTRSDGKEQSGTITLLRD